MERLIKASAVLALILVLAAGCHTGYNQDNNAEYCAGVDEALKLVQSSDLSSGVVAGELYSDVNELGADGHCPGYNPNDSDSDG